MPGPQFRDRRDAGRVLARVLSAYARRPDVRVLGLVPGGVPVALEVAEALGAALDVYLVRRLAVPGHADYAMGAVASGGTRLRNDNVVRLLGLDDADVQAAAESARREIDARERALRDDRPPLDVERCSVVLVDDGLAETATLLAAVKTLRALRPARIVLALPAVAMEACAALRHEADEVVSARPPEPAGAAAPRYEDEGLPEDGTVRDWLVHATA